MLLPLTQQGASRGTNPTPIEATAEQVELLNRAAPEGCRFLYGEGGTLQLEVETEKVLTMEVRRALGSLFGSQLGLTGVFEYNNQYTAQYLCRWPYDEPEV